MWATLPRPPQYVSPEPVRPQVTFRNLGERPLTLSWLAPDGQTRNPTVIPPGQQARRNTSIGHRFLITSADGFRKVLDVTRQRESFDLKGPSPVVGEIGDTEDE